MPHEIDVSTGKAAVFVTGQPPWHGLGTVIEKAADSRQAIVLAGLDWQVQQWPLTANKGTWSQPATNHLANVRTDTRAVLGVVSKRYQVFQNYEAFDFMDSLVGVKLAMYETAGSLQGGRRVWLLVRIPGEYRVGADDLVQPYILLVNNHDGSGPLRMIPTSVRVVCQNTLNLALQGQEALGVSIRHFESLHDRVAEARRTLGIVNRRFAEFSDELQVLSHRSVNTAWLCDYFNRLLPPVQDQAGQLRRAAVIERWHENLENPRQSLAGIRDTAWSAFNSVSEWADHQRTFRGVDTRARSERRLNSIWFGASDQLKRRAYGMALASSN